MRPRIGNTPRPLSAIVTVQEVEKSFGTRRVLAGVSLAIHESDRIALVGVNGSGKSTLMKLIAEAGQEVDAGLITWRRGLSLAYVSQEPQIDPALTIGETLRAGQGAHVEALRGLDRIGDGLHALGGAALDAALLEQAALHERIASLGGWDQEHAVREVAAALELPSLDRSVAALSIGERRRAALGQALLGRPDLLALDEPTNHLDARTVEWLAGALTSLKGALLLVTHDRWFLDRVATRILEIDRGKLFAYEGNYRNFIELQAERLRDETGREQARASFVRRELDWIRRGPQARGTKQKARIDRFDAAVAARPGASERRAGPMALKLPTGGRIGKTILELRGVGKSLGGKRLFKDLTLIIKPGDRIGIVGPNGAGKTTLVRTLLGLTAPDEGEVITGINTRTGFLDQGRAELDDQRTVLQEVAGDSEHVHLDDGPVHVRTFLRMMLFDDGFADTPVGSLSGGERNRVQLAKLLRVGANLLVLDEPTNDLDLMTLGVLEEALREFPGCAIIVSHDRWFLDHVATAILAFEGEGRVVLYEGDFSSYLARRPDPAKGAVEKAVAPPAMPVSVIAAKKLSFKDKQELEVIEASIVSAESRVIELEKQLSDPAIYKDRSVAVPARVAELEKARIEVERLYARWQELEAVGKK